MPRKGGLVFGALRRGSCTYTETNEHWEKSFMHKCSMKFYDSSAAHDNRSSQRSFQWQLPLVLMY